MAQTLTKTQSTVSLDALWALNKSAQIWFSIALLGQLIFVFYIILFYWLNIYSDNFAALNNVLPNGFVKGNKVGNAALLVHLFLAAIITLSGGLQLIPKVRAVAPKFHHWNGRIYLLTVLIISITGLYIVWTADNVAGGAVQQYGLSLNALLIIVFSILTVKHAIARNLAVHRRWALRLFMVVSGVWFFRVGLMFWIMVNQGPVGIDVKTFTGPFVTFIAFANYMLPLAILELYFRAQVHSSSALRWCVSALVLTATVAMLIGISAVTMLKWLPRVY